MSKEERTVKGQLAYINDHLKIFKIPSIQVAKTIQPKITDVYVRKIWKGDFVKYNNPLVRQVINNTIKIIEEKKAKIAAFG